MGSCGEEFDGAIDPGIERAVRIGDVDLSQRSAAGLQRGRYTRDLAGKVDWNFGDTDHGIEAGPKPKGLVLGNEHLDAYHVRTHQSSNKDAAVSRPVQRTGLISSHAILG